MKRNPLSKNSTANSGASGVSLFPHGPPAFGRAARSLSTSLWSAGPQPANSTTAPCAIAPKLRSTVLRIGIKRFRYIVEKLSSCRAQSLEATTSRRSRTYSARSTISMCSGPLPFPARFFPMQIRAAVGGIESSPSVSKRIEGYRKKMMGEKSLWQVWRAGLPQGKQIEVLATRRMKLWANGLDPTSRTPARRQPGSSTLRRPSRRGWQPSVAFAAARSSLLAARASPRCRQIEGQKGHHKTSFDLIRAHGNPLGWKPADMQRAAVVARFHCGALPTRRHKLLRRSLP